MPARPFKFSETMYCSISGAIPSDPVVSVRSGHLYDRSLIEKVLSANGNKCPQTGESLTKEELLSVKAGGTVAPMPPEKSTVPGVLGYVKDEWERLTLQLYEVKKELHETRKELATALYRYDAAVHVIARLEKERDEAVRKMSNGNADGFASKQRHAASASLGTTTPDATEDGPIEVKDGGDTRQLSPGLVELARKKGEELQAERKARKATGVPNGDYMSTFKEAGSVAVDGSEAAVECISVCGDKAYVGCTSGKLHSLESRKVSRSISAHVGGATSVWGKAGSERVYSGGRDGCIRVWDTELRAKGVFEGKKDVVQVERHEVGLVYCCYGDSFKWCDGETGASVGSGSVGEAVSCGAIHPDGMIFATGGKGVRMWDLASMSEVAHLGDRRIVDMGMSEKGYYMVCCDGEVVEVWDLRKQKVVGTVEMAGAAGVCVDTHGEYGCVAGKDGVGLFVAKKRAARVGTIAADADAYTGRRGVAWGEEFVMTGSGAGVVRWYEG